MAPFTPGNQAVLPLPDCSMPGRDAVESKEKSLIVPECRMLLLGMPELLRYNSLSHGAQKSFVRHVIAARNGPRLRGLFEISGGLSLPKMDWISRPFVVFMLLQQFSGNTYYYCNIIDRYQVFSSFPGRRLSGGNIDRAERLQNKKDSLDEAIRQLAAPTDPNPLDNIADTPPYLGGQAIEQDKRKKAAGGREKRKTVHFK